MASPVILLASGGSALIPMLGLNAGLDVLDESAIWDYRVKTRYNLKYKVD